MSVQHPQQSQEIILPSQDRALRAMRRAKRYATVRRLYYHSNQLFNFSFAEWFAFLKTVSKWIILGALVGILAGTASAIFLISLAQATETRLDNQWLLFFLPIGGLVMGIIYWRFGGTASKGNNLVIDEVNNNQSQIPLQMAPLVLIGTVLTHLFGGSAGREGTAIQMGSSLADGLQRLLRLNRDDRRLMIMAGIAGGFGSVFGVPAAGFVFGMEVQNVGRIRYEGIIPCLVASFVGDYVTRAIGASHSHYPIMATEVVDPLLMIKVALAGVAFGLTSMLFIELVHGIKYVLNLVLVWKPLHAFVGGVVVVLLALILNTNDYLGLSLPLISDSVNGRDVILIAFFLKLVFTAITLGSGFYGGEVTPLLVIGATLGYTMGRVLGVEPAFMASVGLVSVFAGASNTPLASSIMGIELVGSQSTLYIFLGCTVAYLASGHRGIYMTQQIAYAKSSGFPVEVGENLQSVATRSKGWLSGLGLSGYFDRAFVRSIMSKHPVAVSASATLDEVVRVAMQEWVRTIPVVDSQLKVVGIITDDDVRRSGLPVNLTILRQMTANERLALLKNYADVLVDQVMTTPVVTISHVASITDVINAVTTNGLKRLPVVDEHGHLLGIVTRSDVLRTIAFRDLSSSPELAELQSVTLGQIPLEKAYVTTPYTDIGQVLHQMKAAETKRIVVVDNSRVVGIVTDSDLLKRIQPTEREAVIQFMRHAPDSAPAFSQQVKDVMTTPVITVDVTAPAAMVLRLLIENQLKRLPVVDDDGQLIGIVGRAVLMRALWDQSDAS